MAVPPIVHAEHRLTRRLRRAGATAPGAAQPVAEGRAIDARALERLMAAGAVRDAGGRRFYLDEAGYHAYRWERRKRVLVALSLVAFVVVVLALSGVLR